MGTQNLQGNSEDESVLFASAPYLILYNFEPNEGTTENLYTFIVSGQN